MHFGYDYFESLPFDDDMWQLKQEKFTPISQYKHDMTQYAGLDLRYIEDIPVHRMRKWQV